MTKKVWIIESGAYSDYRVLAVCASESEAIAVCERANRLSGHGENAYGSWFCSERSFVAAEDVVLLRTHYLDGQGEPRFKDHDKHMNDPTYASVGFVQDEGVANQRHPDDRGDRWFNVQASTPERAAKIIQDHIAQRKAEEAGLA